MAESWTTLRVLEWTTGRFGQAGIDSPRLEAQVLLAHALGCDRVGLYTQYDKPLGEPELAAYRALIRRRLDGEPVAYLTGEQEFWSLPFFVDSRVLIPRRDSETLIEVVIDQVDRPAPDAPLRSATLGASPPTAPKGRPGAERKAPLRIADLCTGSGVLAITLLREFPNATAVGTDLSTDALAVAAKNAERNNVAGRLELREGDLLRALMDDCFDIVVSNPPYIPSTDIAGLSREVKHEPVQALDGGADGLELLRRIVPGVGAHVSPGGLLALEHGFDQADAVRGLIDQTGQFGPAETKRDLANHPRITWARRLR